MKALFAKLFSLSSKHHREVPYRPVRRNYDSGRVTGARYLTFFREYLGPYKWSLALAMLLVCLNANSMYLMPVYTRYVVDNVLLVNQNPDAARPPSESQAQRLGGPSSYPHSQRPWAHADDRPAHAAAAAKRPEHGFAEFSSRPPGAGRTLLIIFLLHFSSLILFNYTARLAANRQIRIGQNVCAILRDRMHEKILKLSLTYHKSHTPGRLLSRIMSDVEVVQDQMMNSLILFVSSVSSLIVGVLILLFSDWKLALIALAVTPFYSLVFAKTRPVMRETWFELRHTNSCMYGLVSQKLDAIKAIQAYGRGLHELLNFRRLSSCFMRDAMSQQRQGALVGQLAGIIAAVGTTAVFAVGAYETLGGQMTIGKMLYVYGAVCNLFMPVLQLTEFGIMFNRLQITMNRLVVVLDEPVEIDDAAQAKPFPVPLRRGLSVRHLRFSYSPEADPVLHNVSFEVPAGQWICIMGPSGCGKSTLLFLLSRLYEPQSGSIEVDGVPLADLSILSLRRQMALVPQEAQIFRGSIRDNICYGYPDAEPGDIMAAAQAAELHELIMSMKVKYETVVGERGISLSGGQRQRLSLARALLTSPHVLLLDDCTSALDAETEHRIQETLTKVLEGRTAIIVSQRVSMAMRCHRIYVLRQGTISEQGSHEELLAQGGFYSRLYRQQTE